MINRLNKKIKATIQSGRKIFREVQTGIDKDGKDRTAVYFLSSFAFLNFRNFELNCGKFLQASSIRFRQKEKIDYCWHPNVACAICIGNLLFD